MIKSSTTVIVVEAVSTAVKFYTEKLGFDLVELSPEPHVAGALLYAQLRKGKFYLMIRGAMADEAVELSQVKHCIGRAMGIYAEMKKGLDKYYARCQKKGVNIVEGIKERPWGDRTFSVKDPHGIKIVFAEPIAGFTKPSLHNFYGYKVDMSRPEDTVVDEMAKHLKKYGIARRPAKKHAKQWIREIKKQK